MAKKPKAPPRGPTYTWSASFQPFKNASRADPQIIGQSLDAIAKQHGGKLKPRQVWEAARAPRHPLHPHFEWDVQKAAQCHWDDTARVLARSVMIISGDAETNEPPRRAWINVPNNYYHKSTEVMTEASLQLSVMKRALTDLDAWITRYNDLENICGEAISTARRQLVARLAASVQASV